MKMTKRKYNYDETLDSYYDDDVYNEYEGYSGACDESYDDYDESYYKRCSVCEIEYLSGLDDVNDMCYDCDEMMKDEYRMKQEMTIVATDANEMLQDEYYLDNGIMDSKIQYDGNVSPDALYLRKKKHM